MWEVRQGDCRDVLPTLPAGAAHLCVTSPPYFGSGLADTPGGYVSNMVNVFHELIFALRGPAYLVIGDGAFQGMPWRVADALRDDGWLIAQELIWAKPGSHDHVFMLSRTQPDVRWSRSVLEPALEPHYGTPFGTLPEMLVEPWVASHTKPGDTVLDPFCGSGTVGVVATGMGRSFVGVELDPASAEWARQRIGGTLVEGK